MSQYMLTKEQVFGPRGFALRYSRAQIVSFRKIKVHRIKAAKVKPEPEPSLRQRFGSVKRFAPRILEERRQIKQAIEDFRIKRYCMEVESSRVTQPRKTVYQNPARDHVDEVKQKLLIDRQNNKVPEKTIGVVRPFDGKMVSKFGTYY